MSLGRGGGHSPTVISREGRNIAGGSDASNMGDVVDSDFGRPRRTMVGSASTKLGSPPLSLTLKIRDTNIDHCKDNDELPLCHTMVCSRSWSKVGVVVARGGVTMSHGKD
ncbi:hypothetical protein V8G54_035680 [Vigna mungo]|uniref:Uncharacterized protein n=1 Tax=Vigna mungo TaxID=3915 RepID=A0AAQ3MFD1_VIGMU